MTNCRTTMNMHHLDWGREIDMNSKGMTLVEIIVSLALISIVLIFLLNLFLLIRTTYTASKMEAEYDLIVSNVVDAVSNDISKYGLESVKEIEEVADHAAYLLTFNAYRPTKLANKIEKVLEVYPESKDGIIRYFINYSYNTKYNNPPTFTKITDIVSDERKTGISRQIPEDALLDSTRYIHIKEMDSSAASSFERQVIEIKIPLANKSGTKYDINIYAILKT